MVSLGKRARFARFPTTVLSASAGRSEGSNGSKDEDEIEGEDGDEDEDEDEVKDEVEGEFAFGCVRNEIFSPMCGEMASPWRRTKDIPPRWDA